MRRCGLVASLLVALAGSALLPSTVGAAPSNWLALDGNIRYNPAGGATHDWGNSGAPAPLNACPAGAVNVSGTGGLFNCGVANPAPAPPSPPSPTPAALADPTRISSVFIVDPFNTDRTACGLGDPTTFTGGAAKNGDAIASYSYGIRPVLNKDKLGNVYAVAHSTAGRPELFFAAERLVNNGDSHVDFEFLQSQVSLSGACAGTFSGRRSEGDLLAAVDFTNGGALATSSLYQWHCATEPGPQPPDGTLCDPLGVPHYQQIAIPGSITFLVNGATIACGGWVCRDTITGNATQVAANDFMEGGIDLTVLNFTGCFNIFLPHTRTAQSFASVLTDFAGPAALPSCRPPAISTTSTPTGGNITPGITTTDTVTVAAVGGGPAPDGTVTFFLCAPAQVTGAGCPAGGTQVGTPKPLVAGAAQSDPTASTATLGTYCWRAAYAPGAGSQGIYASAADTNGTSECFTVGLPAPPDAGRTLDQSPPPAGLVEGPQRLRIPVLALDVSIEAVGVRSDGSMDVPQALSKVGWLDTAPAPGQLGTAVMSGHRDSNTGAPGVFWDLGRLRPGNRLYVTDADGDELAFVVREVAAYPFASFPTYRVFASTDARALNLITCAGGWVRRKGMYDQRLVVYSRLVPVVHAPGLE